MPKVSRNMPVAKLLAKLGWGRGDAIAVLAGLLATVAILINVTLMQKGPHPAPMFSSKPAAVKTAAAGDTPPPVTASVPRPRPDAAPVTPVTSVPLVPARGVPPAAAVTPQAPAPAVPAARTPGAIITDIQRELSRRGFFDGTVDGLYGPKTDRAIRDFEHAAGLKPSHEPNDALLLAIQRAPARVTLVRGTPAAAPSRPAPVRNDVVAERAPPSRRVIALQRVLAEFGYGQIRPTGIIDAETQAAIERFERERRLPVTGQANDRVVRELAAVTGRSVD